MEVMAGATPKGLEEAGVGETPLLEMVLPGVTAIPGAGDEPGSRRCGGDRRLLSRAQNKGEGTIIIDHISRILSDCADYNTSYTQFAGNLSTTATVWVWYLGYRLRPSISTI